MAEPSPHAVAIAITSSAKHTAPLSCHTRRILDRLMDLSLPAGAAAGAYVTLLPGGLPGCRSMPRIRLQPSAPATHGAAGNVPLGNLRLPNYVGVRPHLWKSCLGNSGVTATVGCWSLPFNTETTSCCAFSSLEVKVLCSNACRELLALLWHLGHGSKAVSLVRKFILDRSSVGGQTLAFNVCRTPEWVVPFNLLVFANFAVVMSNKAPRLRN